MKKGTIHSQGRELVSNVDSFMKKEAEEGITIPLKNHRARTLAATGISKSSYQRISRESQIVEWKGPSASFSTPIKKGPQQAKKLSNITIEQTKKIREIIYNFYIVEKRRPTTNCISQKIKSMQILTEDLSMTSLSKFLKQIGFRWQRSRKAIMEDYDIRLKRINYLKAIKQYRNEGRKIIYIVETYIHSSNTMEMEMDCYDETLKGVKKPISKRQGLVIAHAGGEEGFISNGLLIFRSGAKSGEYLDEMNHENFMKWVNLQLLPNLPENSVLVVDNAPYHNVSAEKQVTSASLKNDIINWLTEKNLPADPTLTKPELYKIAKENKFRFPIKYKLDELLKQYGHCVLRLPPYHAEFNPVEKIWATVKNWVATRNTTFDLNDLEALTRHKFDEVTVQDWQKNCDHVKSLETSSMEKEHLFDKALESLQIVVNTSSSEESDTESEGDSSE